MYQWRKFEFFEEKYVANRMIPEEQEEDDTTVNNDEREKKERKIECCSSGRGKVVTGFDDGTVCLFDRGLKFNYSFQPHSSSVLFLQQLKVLSVFQFLQFVFFCCCGNLIDSYTLIDCFILELFVLSKWVFDFDW